MRALGGLAGIAAAAAALSAEPAGAVCSVFSRHPCAPAACSVFRHRPCIPDYVFWIGQDLRLTIESAADQRGSAEEQPDGTESELDTIRAMFDRLRACWVPPGEDQARPGTQLSVRLAFKRSGEIIAAPRVTYVSPDVGPETREIYLNAITAALARCTPLHFSAGMAGAVVGRPIAIRFVDNRTPQGP
jgi:hypothetical protein